MKVNGISIMRFGVLIMGDGIFKNGRIDVAVKFIPWPWIWLLGVIVKRTLKLRIKNEQNAQI